MIGLLDTPRTPLVVGAALAAVTLGTTVVVEDGPILCPFRRCTGGYCPGCGGSRAARALAGGDVLTAWKLHPWVVVLAFQLAVVVAILVFAKDTSVVKSQLRPFARPVLLANAFFGLGLWVARLAAGQIPVPFG